MTLIKSVKTPFNDLMKFQKVEVANELIGLVMSGEPLVWSEGPECHIVCMNDDGDNPTTLSCEISEHINSALATFNRAPDGYELIDFMPSLSEAA